MAKFYEFLADGFEIIEALAPIDILRRGGQEVVTVSIHDRLEVTSAQNQTVLANVRFTDVESFDDADWLLLPGGWPGADNLNKFEPLRRLLLEHYAKGRHIGAICAAPMVIGQLHLLEGKRATCYPSFEEHLYGCTPTGEVVTVDGRITTGKGPAASLKYAYTILSQIISPEELKDLQRGMRYLDVIGEE